MADIDSPFRSISTLLIQRIVLLAIICMMVLGGTHAIIEYQHGRERFQTSVQKVTDNSLRLLSASLWDIDTDAVQSQIDWLATLPEVGHVRVRATAGPVFEAGSTHIENQLATIAVPIMPPEGGTMAVGVLELWADARFYALQILWATLRVILGYMLFTLLVCVMVAMVLRRELREPLRQIAHFATELKPNELARPLQLERPARDRYDEIDLVTQGFVHLQQDLRRHIEQLDFLVTERTRQLEDLLEENKLLSVTDALTNCLNRRALDRRLPAEMIRSEKYERPLSVIFADLDHFKHVNDEWGHTVGDAVLREAAERFRNELREQIDWVARFGGEEFIIVLPESDLQGAEHLAERLRLTIESQPVLVGGKPLAVTASFGVAQFISGETQDDLISRADAMLYQAKAMGRNRVCSAPAQADPQPVPVPA